jgi:hypothetical protein
MTKQKRKTRRSRPTRIPRSRGRRHTRNIRGGRIADREQYTDFIFFNSGINPSKSYEHYIIFNQPPSYEYGVDLGYQIEGIEQELQAYSKNAFVVPSYKYRMKISSDHARTKDEQDAINKKLDRRIERLDDKKKSLEERKR